MVIGVTGGFCTGKSKVASLFGKFGAKVINLDKLAHNALKRGTKSFNKIVKAFGKDILVNNSIERKLLAKKVFGSKRMLTKLNSIIHPVVIKEMKRQIDKLNKSRKAVVVEAPLLFEAKLNDYFDYIIVVKANNQTQIKRAMKEKGLNRKDILKRIASQMPLARKIKMADCVIDNNGPVNNTYKQVRKIWQGFMG
ncbi:MAG: dephospho-CoA kinase [Candidatus Omnitrophica bacterium]|nr:dephospho-CoA kinase [Candidatus Omnitrophota bacterium]